MKEIEKLSIGGYAFMLEKDAADKVSQYIAELEAHYLGKEGGKEIMEGIEERIAELLLERCGRDRAATEADIQWVVDIIGRPERIEADDPEPVAGADEKPRKKLFRDLENQRLGGVCSGLAAYFGGDVAIWRLIFVVVALVLFFSGARHGVWSLTGVVFYCVLWVAMPPAKTARDRWAMKGDSGTIDNILRNVETGAREMGATAEAAIKSDGAKTVLRIIVVVVGIAFLLAGSAGLAAIMGLCLGGTALVGGQVAGLMSGITDAWPGSLDLLTSLPWFTVLLALAVVLPLIGILWAGVQMIFDIKTSWKPGLVVFVLWLMVLVAIATIGIIYGFSNGFWPWG